MSPQRVRLLAAGLGALCAVDAFHTPAGTGTTVRPHPQPAVTTALHMAKKGGSSGKGFGEAKTPSQPKNQMPLEVSEAPIATSQPITTTTTETEEPARMTAGQAALARMRADRQSKKDDELRRIAAMREMDAQVAEEAAAIPERVAQRMGKRMLPFVGIPLFGGMATFVGFWYFATYRDVEFEPVVVAGTTIALLAVSLLGITYSVLSASWDDDREGSGLGIDEFQKNVGSITEGVQRSKENALLRERMAGLPEEEIEDAIRSMEMREEREAKRKESLKEKMEKELS